MENKSLQKLIEEEVSNRSYDLAHNRATVDSLTVDFFQKYLRSKILKFEYEIGLKPNLLLIDGDTKWFIEEEIFRESITFREIYGLRVRQISLEPYTYNFEVAFSLDLKEKMENNKA